MEEDRETPRTTPGLQNGDNGETASFHDPNMYSDDIDSSCSTPYVSAPSSPGRGGGGGFFYSAPASPMHFVLCSPSPNSTAPVASSSVSGSFEFDFSARFGTIGSAMAGSMSSADELFLNGQIRPMKLSTHLKRPQMLAPLIDLDETEGDCENVMDEEADKFPRGRDVKWRDRSLRRRTRSMSPLRTSSFNWHESDEEDNKTEKVQSSAGNEEIEVKENETASGETTPSMSASSSRSSSVSRSSKRWVFLKEFLYRSKSEGRNNGHKFWTSISFSPVKDRKAPAPPLTEPISSSKGKASNSDGGTTDKKVAKSKKQSSATGVGRPSNVVGKRRVPASAHELHYKANRAHAEEMRKKTFLPYRQGLLGCLGFSSKSYGAMNGFTRVLNPVSSR
ncbi:uncharacterized protein LOC130755964 [Actinidia eriantha]|uniref:uncharacterized protein LOC130755964 n=1 Tax=Actinidia eriantha TaxID=165200 RepID=UPI00258DFC6D|nr:uncharacterized protein LOC130755964 [Actinidia eriantha]